MSEVTVIRGLGQQPLSMPLAKVGESIVNLLLDEGKKYPPPRIAIVNPRSPWGLLFKNGHRFELPAGEVELLHDIWIPLDCIWVGPDIRT